MKIPGNPPTGGQRGQVQPQTFTKERVNELMQRRIERSHKAFFDRYGVSDLKGLDELFGKAGSVDGLNQKIEELTKSGTDLQSKLDELTNRNRELSKKYAFTSRNIRPELYSDIETYFKGKGLDINEETLSEELKTHQDWYGKSNAPIQLGQETHSADVPSEREMAGKLLGVEL